MIGVDAGDIEDIEADHTANRNIVALRQQADSRPNLILSSLFPPDSERQMLNAKLASRYAPILRSEGD